MANDNKKPGVEPGKSQAKLDEAFRRLGGIEAAIEGLTAKTSQDSDQQSEALGQLSKSVAGIAEKLAAVDGFQASVERIGQDVQASASSQSELTAAIARRFEQIDQRMDRQDANIKLMFDVLTKLATSDESAAAKAGKLAESTTAALDLLNILADEQRTAGSAYQTLSAAVAQANSENAADRAVIGQVVNNVDDKLKSIGEGVTTTIGQVVKLRRKTNHIGISTTRIDRNVSRILALMDVVIQGIEASQVYLAEVQYSVRTVEKGMLTAKMFFKVNKAMRDDLISAMNKLPDELKRSTKDILQAAARIKHEAETYAEGNKSQLGLLKAQVEQLIKYYSVEGQGVIDLLRESATQFNTNLSNEIGKAKLLLDREIEMFLEGSRKKLDGFADQLKASDFHKVLEGLGAAYTNAQNLTKEISKAIAELDTAREKVNAEITAKVDQIKSTTKLLADDIRNARTDATAASNSYSTIRDYLVETNGNLLAYMERAKDAHGIAQRMVEVDRNGQLAFYQDLFEMLTTKVVAGVEKTNNGYFEQIGLGILTQDLDSSSDTDE